MGNCHCSEATEVVTEAVKPIDNLVSPKHFMFLYCFF